jgi:hypothetical protein
MNYFFIMIFCISSLFLVNRVSFPLYFSFQFQHFSSLAANNSFFPLSSAQISSFKNFVPISMWRRGGNFFKVFTSHLFPCLWDTGWQI